MSDTLSQTKERLATAPLFRVYLLNDDYTPMDFVVEVLQRYFRKSETEAMQIMLEAHEKGVGLAGVYTFEIAETKVSEVERRAQEEGYPLRCVLEPENA